MTTVYLACFALGLLLSVLAVISGAGHLHVGHIHLGHGVGHGTGHAGHAGGHNPAVNGFTVAAFLCWFGGVGYLLQRFRQMPAMLLPIAAVLAGLMGAALVYSLIFKLLLPRERVLRVEDTRMEGTLARVSNAVREPAGVGEILFTQTGTRRSSPARSADGRAIPRDTEVIVLRYERGVAYVRPFHEAEVNGATDSSTSTL